MKPTAAKGRFPYPNHRTMAEVMRDEAAMRLSNDDERKIARLARRNSLA